MIFEQLDDLIKVFAVFIGGDFTDARTFVEQLTVFVDVGADVFPFGQFGVGVYAWEVQGVFGIGPTLLSWLKNEDIQRKSIYIPRPEPTSIPLRPVVFIRTEELFFTFQMSQKR